MLSIELLFSQQFVKHCPYLNLLSLINETELTNNFTLTASLAASDAVQLTLIPSTTEIDVMEVTTLMSTTMAETTEVSLFMLIVVVIGAMSVCFITTIISCTVITACYCQRAKMQKTVTKAVEPTMFQLVDNHSYRGLSRVNTGIYYTVKPKTDPLPEPPEEQYEDVL